MEFAITRLSKERTQRVEIAPERYIELEKARRSLVALMTIEEIYDLLRVNYRDVEQELLHRTLDHALFSASDWNSGAESIISFNRLFLNMLSASRLYIDHVPQSLKELAVSEKNIGADFRNKASEIYDGRKGYRVMYALRNYIQHQSWGVTGITWNQDLLPDQSQGNGAEGLVNRIGVSLSLTLESIRGSSFKKEILDELEADGSPKIDLKPLMRESMDGFHDLQTWVRKIVKNSIPTWESAFNDAIKDFHAAFSGARIGITAARYAPTGEVLERQQLLEDIITRRKALADKNNNFAGLSKSSVTS